MNISDRAKSSTTGGVVWVVNEIKQLHLLQWSLTGGQTPRF